MSALRIRPFSPPVAFVALLLTGFAASPAAAERIQYIFTGVGSGTVGERLFTNAPFTIVATADTKDVQRVPELGGDLIYSVAAPAMIQIEGIGGGAINVPTRVFSSDPVPGGVSPFPMLGLSRLPHYDGINLLDVDDPSLAGYALRTATGPVFEDNPGAVDQFQNVPSALGRISFRDMDFVIFRAVPEPSGLLLLPLTAFVLRRRR